LLFKSVPVKAEAKVLTASISFVRACQQRTERAYAIRTPKLLVKVDKISTQAMLNTKAKVNVITRAAINKLRLLVCTDLLLALKAVLGDTQVFNKAYKNVKINIKRVVNH
jgi:hypothetical protein